MSFLQDLINFILHVDQFLGSLIQQFGLWTYVILFLVIFAETGFVATPFFPGDSLIFIAGTFGSINLLNIELLFVIFSLAAILGDTANYWIGHLLGPKVFKEKNARFFKKEYLDMAEDFYERHGGKTIFLARFIPVIRTFAPFIAGIGKMKYGKFLAYNVLGGIAWVSVFLFGGYYFGNIPIVRDNLSIVIIGIIIVSFMPIIVKSIQEYKKSK